MHPIRNPFIAGGPVPPERFVGRAKEVYAIMGRLTATRPASSAIFGEARIGKTSLLHYINSDQVKQDWSISSKNFTFVYLDCGGIDDPLFVNFWKTLFIKIGK
jgi:AAA+ ATPase superfamily predicted ATPase